MTKTMNMTLDAQEMKLIDECRLYEPWLEDNLRRARRKKKGQLYVFLLEGEEQRDILSALEASSHFAREEGQTEKAVDFSVLHDKIILLTPEDFVLEPPQLPGLE